MPRGKANSAAKDEHHAPLERFIRENLVVPRGFWGRLLLGSQEREHEIREITTFEDGGFFRKSRVVQVLVNGTVLEGKVLPSGGSFGLFALDGDRIHYLSRRQHEVEALFGTEGRPLDECAPIVLARFLAAALLRRGNESDDVLASGEALVRYDGGRDGFGGPYVLDSAEWTRIQGEFVAPTLVSRSDGWEIAFTSVQGWMHMKEKLVRHRFRFAADFRLTADSRVLSHKIFAATPGVMY